MRKILIDDVQMMNVDRIARTVSDGMNALQYEGPWDELFLDHDPGEPSDDYQNNGYYILCWLENNRHLLPGKITLVTSNPSARVKMQLALERLYS